MGDLQQNAGAVAGVFFTAARAPVIETTTGDESAERGEQMPNQDDDQTPEENVSSPSTTADGASGAAGSVGMTL